MAIEISDGDYTLKDGAGWFDVKGFAIRIHATDEGVVVDILDRKALNAGDTEAVVASTYAYDNELQADAAAG